MQKVRFPSEIQELHRILYWLRSQLIEGGVPTEIINKLELASEEAIVNVINHAYPEGKREVEITLKWSPGQVEIALRDWGYPFNPLENVPKIDLLAPIEERQPGGLGIYLMQQIMDELIYVREKDQNLLTMIKRFSQKK